MSKHTPGPWKVVRSNYGASIAGATHSIMPPGFDSDAPKNKWPMSLAMVPLGSANCDADVSLIAAAPDLLAALKLARASLAAESQVPERECVGGDFVQINAAIAKAEAQP